MLRALPFCSSPTVGTIAVSLSAPALSFCLPLDPLCLVLAVVASPDLLFTSPTCASSLLFSLASTTFLSPVASNFFPVVEPAPEAVLLLVDLATDLAACVGDSTCLRFPDRDLSFSGQLAFLGTSFLSVFGDFFTELDSGCDSETRSHWWSMYGW